MPMVRAKLKPVMDACKSVVETIPFDGGTIPVGLSVAPDCPRPFVIITSVPSPRYSGPMGAIEADSMDRIQFTATAMNPEQSDWLRDQVREVLTIEALDAQFVSLSANRRVLRVILDIPRGVQRDDRGLPAPIFNSIDQYMIETTPT